MKCLNVGEKSIGCLVEGGKLSKEQALAFETAEKILRNGVVIGVTLATHALAKTHVEESETKTRGGLRDAAIGVEDKSGRGFWRRMAMRGAWSTRSVLIREDKAYQTTNYVRVLVST